MQSSKSTHKQPRNHQQSTQTYNRKQTIQTETILSTSNPERKQTTLNRKSKTHKPTPKLTNHHLANEIKQTQSNSENSNSLERK